MARVNTASQMVMLCWDAAKDKLLFKESVVTRASCAE